MKRISPFALVLLCTALACRRETVSPSGNASPAPDLVGSSSAAPATETSSSTTSSDAAEPPLATPVTGAKLQPVDEGKDDPSFSAFRAQLLEAVIRRDVDAVVAASDPAIRTSFGGGGGAQDLREVLKRPAIWTELETILRNGGNFVGGDRRSFWAPWIYSSWPDRHDAFTQMVVIEDGVPLRERPEASSPALATLSYDIVARDGQSSAESAWTRVKTEDGRSGFVESSKVRSPIGYRAGFIMEEGMWKMNALVAGD